MCYPENHAQMKIAKSIDGHVSYWNSVLSDVFNKIEQDCHPRNTSESAVDKEAIRLSRVYSYDSKYTCPYSMCNPP